MKFGPFFIACLICAALPAASAQAGCLPVKAEVVSLGEKAARFYTERSLIKHIDEEKRAVESSGREIGRIVKGELACAPYPNLIGADEWRCTGEAKVCTKS
jgi:hypothetical protein